MLSTIWGRLKGKGGSTFDRLTTNLFAESPTIVAYDEMAKKKSTAFAVKVKCMLLFAPDWEYDGQGGMATAKDYQLIPTIPRSSSSCTPTTTVWPRPSTEGTLSQRSPRQPRPPSCFAPG